jgi:hypothetical protein
LTLKKTLNCAGIDSADQKMGVKKNSTLIVMVIIYFMSGKKSETDDVNQVIPISRTTIAKR